jgi:TPR repeat protein
MKSILYILFLLLLLIGRAVADDVEAAKQTLAKATRGDAHAQRTMAYRYRDGKGVTRDYAEAMRWARPLADRGDAEAMDFVGWMFFQGLGVKRNPEVAAGYFRAAAGKSATAAVSKMKPVGTTGQPTHPSDEPIFSS